MRALFLVLSLLVADQRSEWNSLVEAERAFARLSAASGIKNSFLTNLADNGIIFRPNAVRGREWMQNNPESAAQLTWEPEFADVAAAGDLGYTTGPWEIRRTAQEPPAGFGHYVTLWRKQQDGAWKVELDTGVGHDPLPRPSSVGSPKISGQVGTALSESQIQRAHDAFIAIEQRFPTTSDKYASMLAPDARLYRDGSAPFIGEQSIRAALNDRKGTFTWNLQGSGISRSGDLGYIYGAVTVVTAASNTPETNNYVRIWKKQPGGKWRVVLDILA